ncbi:glycosyltransferase family 4 protein [uncultured Psychroserpens sp.]|uniref:glycosyltransferase family 4 protein n=1 Tax=uncultured Psychroserpens sp. TaxID=255436 RepID=UPI002609870D|nr:glycosyltransferase family 4 protein [uncultured Psychroserpens sp.]
MKKILYIGNKLNKTNSNVSYISILGDLLTKEGFKVFYASGYNNKILRLLHMVYKVVFYSRKVEKVLIDTYSTQNYYYAFIVSQICRLLKLDYIPILHGGNLPSRLTSHPKMSQKIFKNALYNIAPSAYLKNAFEQHGFKRVIHIPNTLEIKEYNFSIKEFDMPRLLWVRSFSKLYNPQLAIEVFKSLKHKYPNAKLCMVGPDSDGTFGTVKDMVKEENLEVRFTGKLKKKEWIELSKDYNIFLNTTNFDNMPLSVIEAMALGLAVVSTNVGGMPYLIKNNHEGYLVKPNDVTQMVNAITTVMNAEETQKVIIKNARDKVEQLDWSHIKKKWFDILK